MTKLIYTKEDSCYTWKISGEENRYFTTNPDGEGIFEVSFSSLGGNRRQLAGTCQFSTRGLTDAYAKKKIRRWMAEQMEK